MAAPVPRLSIGMPVYNGARFIRKSIDALLGQTYSDFELVISDNASTDDTAAICQTYAARDPRIRYERQQANRGAAFNYNRVFELARAERFKWAAADDLCALEYLERCMEALDRHADAVLAYPKTMIIDEVGAPKRPYPDDLGLDSGDPVARFRTFLRNVGECNAVFGIIRSAALRQTRLIGNYMSSDVILLGELSLHGSFHEISETLFFRRDHESASSADKSLESQQEFFDPETTGKLSLLQWRHQLEYLKVLSRAPVSASDKVRLGSTILRRYVTKRRGLARELGAALRYWSGRRSIRRS